ncbi:hypothetical protein DB345_12310 [Spartobacteria bacterium LR76]|nr:hypothetical protein DB345_12310 [Spartobacteria bacterium LR76]
MTAPSSKDAQSRIEVHYKAINTLCGIHPDDAHLAICAKLKHKNTNVTLKKIDDLMIDALVCMENNLTSVQKDYEQRRRKDDPAFAKKLDRARYATRKPTFSQAELFVLQNWRRICPAVKKGVPVTDEQRKALCELAEKVPGLREWSPDAAGAFMERFGLFRSAVDVRESFKKTWQRLGLKSFDKKKIVGLVETSNGYWRFIEPGDL